MPAEVFTLLTEFLFQDFSPWELRFGAASVFYLFGISPQGIVQVFTQNGIQ